MRDHDEAFAAAGARVAAIGLGGSSYARQFRRETGIRFPLLVDEQRESYDAAELKRASVLDLLRPENFSARRRAAAAGHRQHRLGRNPLQLGGSFVFAPGNLDLYAHVSRTFGDIARVEDLLAAIARPRRPVG